MKRLLMLVPAILISCIAPAAAIDAGIVEITCFAPRALQSTLNELVPEFERSSGYKVSIEYGSAGALTERLQKGEFADVAIVSNKQMDDLEKQGKIVAASKVALAKVGVAMMVRRGAPKPDVSSVDAFKKSMLAANSIAHTDPKYGGPAGMYMNDLFDKIGIGAEMRPKTKLVPPAAPLYNAVINGDAEIGFDQLSQIIDEPKVVFAGVLPKDIQNYTRFAVGLVTITKHKDATKALIAFLSSPTAVAVMKAKGFDPD